MLLSKYYLNFLAVFFSYGADLSRFVVSIIDYDLFEVCRNYTFNNSKFCIVKLIFSLNLFFLINFDTNISTPVIATNVNLFNLVGLRKD